MNFPDIRSFRFLSFTSRSIAITTLFCIGSFGQSKNQIGDAQRQHLFFSEDFEGSMNKSWEYHYECSNCKIEMVTEKSREGKYSNRTRIDNAGDSKESRKRAEIRLNKGEINAGANGDERWYGYSIFLPRQYWEDIRDISRPVLIQQFHDHPRDACDYSEGGPTSLDALNGHLAYNINFDTDGRKCSDKSTFTKRKLPLTDIIYDQWIDFVYHIKWTHNTDGFLDAWVNGKKVVEYRGRTANNDDVSRALKLGIYQPRFGSEGAATTPGRRVIYHDVFRMGTAKASYCDVAPYGAVVPEGLDCGGSVAVTILAGPANKAAYTKGASRFKLFGYFNLNGQAVHRTRTGEEP